jgi:hypothetical protein
MPKKPKQSKLTKSAKGQECQIRIPHICNFDTETTVFAHLNGGGGGMKHSDIHGAYACSNCHDAVDARRYVGRYCWDTLKLMHLEGMVRTQILMLKAGLIKI